MKSNTKIKKHKTNNKIKYSECYYQMQDEFDKLYERSKNNENFNKLTKIICKEENIMLAYRNLKSNKGSSTTGTDNKNITFLAEMTKEQLIKYVNKRFENFICGNVRRVWIPKGNGKKRPLGIPTIGDRLIQQCIKQVLD